MNPQFLKASPPFFPAFLKVSAVFESICPSAVFESINPQFLKESPPFFESISPFFLKVSPPFLKVSPRFFRKYVPLLPCWLSKVEME